MMLECCGYPNTIILDVMNISFHRQHNVNFITISLPYYYKNTLRIHHHVQANWIVKM